MKRYAESARQLTGADALITGLREELRQERENRQALEAEAARHAEELREELRQERGARLKSEAEAAHYLKELQEARAATDRYGVQMTVVSQEMGELVRRMAQGRERETGPQQTTEGAALRAGLSHEGPAVREKRKRVAEPAPTGEGGPGADATPSSTKADARSRGHMLRRHLRTVEQGIKQLVQEVEEGAGTSSALRRELEGERSRSGAAEQRVARMDRSILQFAEGLEPPLTEVAVGSAVPDTPVPATGAAGAAPAEQGKVGDGERRARSAGATMVKKEPGPAP